MVDTLGRAAGLTVVILAAGRGTRFGGRKQLVPIAPDGATLPDVLMRRAAEAGFGRAVLVIAPDMPDDVQSHLSSVPDTGIPIALAIQERSRGTADAVFAARSAINGSFVVVNGDDLYPSDAFVMLHDHLVRGPDDEHALVAFRVARSFTGTRPVMRARIEVDARARLVSIREGSVVPGGDGLRFEVDGEAHELPDDALVSMNMWAFRPSIFDVLQGVVDDAFDAIAYDGEVYLPDAVAAQMATGTTVRVLVSEEPCIGVTHPEDLAAVRDGLG